MDDEHIPQSHSNTNYLPVETDIEKSNDSPLSKPSTWRYNPDQYFDRNVMALTILTQRQIFQVRAFRHALQCYNSRSRGLFGLSPRE